MLHVNDDTNDELFRRAAEDYFLGAGNADWETLLKKMNTGESFAGQETICSRSKRHYPFLFLFSGPRAIFRLFRRSSWLIKSKKKINARIPFAIICRAAGINIFTVIAA